MPEKPEVITVANSLKPKLIGKTITDCQIYWDNIIAYPSPSEFKNEIKNQKIEKITTRGKWLVFELTRKALLIHLRMEGKFFFRKCGEEKNKHEHVVFTLDDKEECRFHDVRKFGKMYLLEKEKIYSQAPLAQLGYEYNDSKLTSKYLYQCFQKRTLPIKTVLLDQNIIAGIGNIYDDEILFLSHIHPERKASSLSEKECSLLIANTKIILEKAIKLGGTTIKSFTSREGVHGRFQNELLVHGKKDEKCPVCGNKIQKIKVGGRGTYFCKHCQK